MLNELKYRMVEKEKKNNLYDWYLFEQLINLKNYRFSSSSTFFESVVGTALYIVAGLLETT